MPVVTISKVRDATVLSSVQDQIENKEQQEVKQLLQECDDNLRIAAERRAVAEKAERMLKGSLGMHVHDKLC